MTRRKCSSLRWRHNGRDSVSPASPLFTQPFIQTLIKENIEAPRHWPLCGEFTGTGEFPAQMTSNAEMFPFHDVIMQVIVYNLATICSKQNPPTKPTKAWKAGLNLVVYSDWVLDSCCQSDDNCLLSIAPQYFSTMNMMVKKYITNSQDRESARSEIWCIHICIMKLKST